MNLETLAFVIMPSLGKPLSELIPPEDWGFASALPIEAFVKKTKQQVWKDSMATQQMTL